MRSQRRDLERLLPRVQPCKPQEVFDEALHARAVPGDDLEELARLLGVALVIQERFDVSANRGERRAKLVGNVGDEIAPDLIGAAKIGDVVEHQNCAAASHRGHGRRARDERPARIARHRELSAFHLVAAQRRLELRRDVGMADDFDIRPADCGTVHLEHRLRGAR